MAEKLQTQLEDCFGPEWEDSDHSSDDMYANVQEEVKDVEYHSNTDAAKPTMRMLINHDKNGDKYTLYIRVQ